MHQSDICIAGAGIIGLTLALELQRRGARVTVLEQGTPLVEASTAAAGMLAANDSHNPPEMRPLADLSLSLYPAFLEQLRNLSGMVVPFQTSTTLQGVPSHLADDVLPSLTPEELHQVVPQLVPGDRCFVLLDEHSLDPRQLATALLAAIGATTIDLRTQARVVSIHSWHESVEVQTTSGTFHCAQFVDCTGAWASGAWAPGSSTLPRLDILSSISPRKGQMLAVALPDTLQLRMVVRTSEIYIVPRREGPNAGRAVIGATIEDVGFDKTVHSADIARLRSRAASLLPELASAHMVESWAGLRPATSDGLPLLGLVRGQSRCFLASGHYRNGILLAPATAHVMAQLLSGEEPSIELASFSPSRIFRTGG
jgi:glycine oxidase